MESGKRKVYTNEGEGRVSGKCEQQMRVNRGSGKREAKMRLNGKREVQTKICIEQKKENTVILLGHRNLSPSLHNIPVVSGGFELLGNPVGLADFCEVSFQKRILKVQGTVARLADLHNSDGVYATSALSCLTQNLICALHLSTRPHPKRPAVA